MIVLHTARTLVRHLEVADFDILYRLCSDVAVAQWMGDGQPLTPEQTRRWITVSQANYERHGRGCMAVIHREQGVMIGFCGLIDMPGSADVEIIYAFLPDYWGSGYATEVGRAMLRWGLQEQKLPKIYATIDAQNSASIRAAEKMGLAYQTTARDDQGYSIRWYLIDREAPETAG